MNFKKYWVLPSLGALYVFWLPMPLFLVPGEKLLFLWMTYPFQGYSVWRQWFALKAKKLFVQQVKTKLFGRSVRFLEQTIPAGLGGKMGRFVGQKTGIGYRLKVVGWYRFCRVLRGN